MTSSETVAVPLFFMNAVFGIDVLLVAGQPRLAGSGFHSPEPSLAQLEHVVILALSIITL
jgi:hypothetical protein